MLCLEPKVKESFDRFQIFNNWSQRSLGDSLMKTHENVRMHCVKEQMTDGDGKDVKMGFEDWDIIGQGTSPLTTITTVVK
jgi:hypothetical protein